MYHILYAITLFNDESDFHLLLRGSPRPAADERVRVDVIKCRTVINNNRNPSIVSFIVGAPTAGCNDQSRRFNTDRSVRRWSFQSSGRRVGRHNNNFTIGTRSVTTSEYYISVTTSSQ